MKLSGAIVLRALADYPIVCGEGISSPDFELSRPIFLRRGDRLAPGHIYITDAVQDGTPPPRVPESSVLLCISPQKLSNIGKRTANLFGEIDPREVSNRLQILFDDFDAWDEELQTLLYSDTGVDAFLKSGERRMDSLLFLHNSDYAIVASSRKVPLDVQDMDENTTFCFNELVNALKKDPEFNRMKQYQSVFALPVRITGGQSLCCNFFGEAEDFHYRLVAVGGEHGLDDCDVGVFTHLARYVGLAVRRPLVKAQLEAEDKSAERLRELLHDLLRQSPANQQRALQQLGAYGWSADHSFCVLAVHVTVSDIENNTVRMLCNQIERLLPEASAFELEGRVAVIANLTVGGRTTDALLRALVYFVRDNYLKVGVSGVCRGIGGLYDHYRQSDIALKYACEPDATTWILRFDDVAVRYMVDNCPGVLPSEMVCSSRVLAMREYDDKHGTEFYKTLRVFIGCRFNALQSSRELFIHRSTFNYRLERIVNQFHINTDDPTTLLHALLTFRLLGDV